MFKMQNLIQQASKVYMVDINHGQTVQEGLDRWVMVKLISKLSLLSYQNMVLTDGQ